MDGSDILDLRGSAVQNFYSQIRIMFNARLLIKLMILVLSVFSDWTS